MAELPSFNEWTRDELVDSCTMHGLSDTGRKTDLVKRLYAIEIEKHRSAYEARKDKGFVQDVEGTKLLVELQQLEAVMETAAKRIYKAEVEYLSIRLSRAKNEMENSTQMASILVQEEDKDIKMRLRVRRDRRAAREVAREEDLTSNLRNVTAASTTKATVAPSVRVRTSISNPTSTTRQKLGKKPRSFRGNLLGIRLK